MSTNDRNSLCLGQTKADHVDFIWYYGTQQNMFTDFKSSIRGIPPFGLTVNRSE